ncbi:hypothetical protein PbB2_01376 [Candidatus Phycosocius bacilliformis]|uniref:VOC domain-containing protein n=1 Tax=Candidatus Phycosocius bacilliformis TaxID=1445552 RepID=A0A2P2E9G1_9PROT|nr:VOC family protein [Candidatus Phycosocius bacilliformis]GBF57707.1 hypothetical protein PbB2_01376 [Candidatus Phycosocius bacilliformis]
MAVSGRILGIGGVFIKSPAPDRLRAWYQTVLGVEMDAHGALFALSGQDGHQVFSPFPTDTAYFAPSTREVMINFRVDDLLAMIERIEAAGAKLEGPLQEESYGKFAWIIDPDGTKIELWQETGDLTSPSA